MCSTYSADAHGLLSAGLSALAEQQPGELDGVALAEQLTELHRLSSVLAAQIVRRVAVFHTRGDAAAEGMTSTSAFLSYRLRMTRAEARQAVVTATRLTGLPGTAEAFAAGEISARHAGVLCDGAERIGVELLADAEPILLAAAAAVDPGRLRQIVRHLRYVVDVDGQDAEAAADFGKRGLYASTTFDGMIAVDGLLDPDTGAALMAAITSGPPPLAEDGRSAAQRRADRLGEVLRRAAAVEDGARTGGQPTQLTLTAGIETLQGVPGAPPAYLDWIGPLDVTTTRLLSCDCQVTGVVTDVHDGPLDVGWKHRTVTGAQRTALAVRDRHCQAPGCDRPHQWTDAHHVLPWYLGGRTDLDNLLLLCRRHHRAVHQEIWRIHALGRGRFRFELHRSPPRENDAIAQRAPAPAISALPPSAAQVGDYHGT